jgi:hypothetical protein
MAAAGAGGDNLYIEDVFSTYLYTGNASTQTITNGIDLAGEGGLVWGKRRNASGNHFLSDTTRGATKNLKSDLTSAEQTGNALSAFTSSGFSLATTGALNASGDTYASWTFRKAPKFFDVVTYTGTGNTQTIAHNLGSVPGCIIVKAISTASNWCVYHRGIGNTQFLSLNLTNAAATLSMWGNTDPTSTTFTTGGFQAVGELGTQYVAYIFAHDAGGFGLTGTDNVISCGSYTSDGSGNATVNLGYEPQWVMVKAAGTSSQWFIWDTMRGLNMTNDSPLNADSSSAESTSIADRIDPTATGFNMKGFVAFNTQFIYIAIRRGPMKVPTDGTKVFQAGIYTGNAGFPTITTGSNSISDLVLFKPRTTTSFNDYIAETALTRKRFFTNSPDMEGGPEIYEYLSNGFSISNSLRVNDSGVPYVYQAFRRAPKFADVVCWTNSSLGQSVSHNLAAAPELILVKRRQNSEDWQVYAATLGASAYLVLNSTAAAVTGNTNRWNGTPPTASVFTTGGYFSYEPYIAYLFATCPGVSKVGSYTGTGTASVNQINCGFTTGARFVLVKRTDSTGDWYVWDTARGIVSGNDPYLRPNTTAHEVTSTDWIDPLSSGFELSNVGTNNANNSGASYIFLAIA